MSSSGKFDRWGRWLKVTFMLGATAVLALVLLAGCGGGSSSSSTAAEPATTEAEGNSGETEPAAETEAADESTVSEAELQKTVNEALSSEKFKASELEPLVKE
ncbi:MAG: hypothetical protein J0H06_04485, partial [Actinobacteria bacterium]|nr:hypothetical protein [Actinomycetota bacterium]